MNHVYRILHLARRIYWLIFRPKTAGARALVISKNKILLVKHSYIKQWYLPGGGLKRNELFKDALRRELFEEVGLNVNVLKPFGSYNNIKEGKRDKIKIFIIKQKINESQLLPHDHEIREIKMFPLDQLPDVSPGTKRRINEYLGKIPKTTIW